MLFFEKYNSLFTFQNDYRINNIKIHHKKNPAENSRAPINPITRKLHNRLVFGMILLSVEPETVYYIIFSGLHLSLADKEIPISCIHFNISIGSINKLTGTYNSIMTRIIKLISVSSPRPQINCCFIKMSD